MDARKVFEECYRTYLSSDWAGFAELLGEDVVLESPGSPPVRGRDAVLAYHQATRQAFPDMGGDYTVILGNDTMAGGRKTTTGTNTGPLTVAGGNQMPATGQGIEIPESDWMEIRDGKCVHHWIYYDRSLLLQQLGLAAGR